MDDVPTDGFRQKPLWLLGVAALIVAQAGLALSLFGAGRTFDGLLNDQPILSGRHPLHQYHGSIGAQAFLRRGATNCFDPAFQAGYPKTPVFDGGCRPAELFLALAGGEFRPSAYKTGLFVCLLLIPLAFMLSARGAGAPAGAAVLAGAGGAVLGWSWPVRRLLEEGEFDFLTAGLAVIVFVSWLGRYARWFDIDSWLVLAGTAAVGWYAHPVVWIGLAPVLIAYYLVYAPNRELAWHLGLAGIVTFGLAPNLWWLLDWGRFWWLRQPSPTDHIPLPGCDAILGCGGDYLTLMGYIPWGGAVLTTAVVGALGLWRAGNRAAVALIVTVALVTVVGARLLAAWPRVPADAAERLVPLTAGLLILPAAAGLWAILGRARLAAPAAGLAVLGLLLLGWADGPGRPLAAAARMHLGPLQIGFTPDQERLIAALQEHTTTEARVLLDESTDVPTAWNWTALLPILTGRTFLGGLDHDAGMEFSHCGLRESKLNGRLLSEWTDAELTRFCEWYNVGWVVCRSGPAVDRWGRYPPARAAARLPGHAGGHPITIFAIERPRSFFIRGTGKWETASTSRVSLTDVQPDANGEVWLSLHSPPDGLHVYPSYIRADPPAPDRTGGGDPVNLIRLLLPGPTPRITLVWEGP